MHCRGRKWFTLATDQGATGVLGPLAQRQPVEPAPHLPGRSCRCAIRRSLLARDGLRKR